MKKTMSVFAFFTVAVIASCASFWNYVPTSGCTDPAVSGRTGLFDAGLLVLNDGDNVSSWSDTSGSGQHLDQVGATPPVYKTNIINGKPVVRFDGVSTTQLYSTANASSFVTTTALSVFLVFKTSSISTAYDSNPSFYQNAVLWADKDNSNVGMFLSSTGPYVYSANYPGATGKTIALNTAYIVHKRQDGSTNYISVNNGAESSATQAIGAVANKLAFGMSGGSAAGQFDLAYAEFYNVALSSGDVSSVYSYLNCRFATY